MSALVLERLQIGYGTQILLREASVRLPESRLTCLLGPNGTGKSSLLRTLCGMQAAQAGKVFWPVAMWRRCLPVSAPGNWLSY